jgi:hypothetical protein
MKAINARVDLLLIGYDGEKIYDALYALLEADKTERLDKGMLETSRMGKKPTKRICTPYSP